MIAPVMSAVAEIRSARKTAKRRGETEGGDGEEHDAEQFREREGVCFWQLSNTPSLPEKWSDQNSPRGVNRVQALCL